MLAEVSAMLEQAKWTNTRMSQDGTKGMIVQGDPGGWERGNISSLLLRRICSKESAMRKLASVNIGMFLVCGSLFCGLEWCGVVPDDNTPRIVKYSDIPTKVQVVGRLGTHLGEEIITIRGTWKQPEAVLEDTFKFVVTSINGKEIRTPIEIPCSDVEPVGPRGNVT